MHRLLAWMKPAYYSSVYGFLLHFEARMRHHDRLGFPLHVQTKNYLLLRALWTVNQALTRRWMDQLGKKQMQTFEELLAKAKRAFPRPDPAKAGQVSLRKPMRGTGTGTSSDGGAEANATANATASEDNIADEGPGRITATTADAGTNAGTNAGANTGTNTDATVGAIACTA
ncbi:MAG: hypothetical protein STHCBS139747_007009 [Sporothrix thermara]